MPLAILICSTPVIRKLYQSYEQKIIVISKFKEVFADNQYVQNTYLPGSLNIDYIKKEHIYHNSFYNIGKKNERGIEMKHNCIDIRQFHAINLGFMLTHEELMCDFIPKPICPYGIRTPTFEKVISERNYVCLHPVQTWPSRTWAIEKWQSLADQLAAANIPVVTIGRNAAESGFFNVDKPIFDIKVTYGYNLMNQTTINDCWHLINHSLCFVTMDSGLLHLAGTTDANIYSIRILN